MTEEIHFEVCPYRHNASMDATPPYNAMRPPPAPRARCNHQCAAMEARGHSELGAFGTGDAIGP